MSSDTNPKTGTNGAADPMSAIIQFWSQWMEQTARGTQAVLEAVGSATDTESFKKRWIEAASESSEQFLRTPAFMEMMREHLKAITDLKRMQDNVVHDAARQLGFPLADDITGLFERLDSTERKILSRLQAIEERLGAIEAQSNGATGTKKRSSAGHPTTEATTK